MSKPMKAVLIIDIGIASGLGVATILNPVFGTPFLIFWAISMCGMAIFVVANCL